MYFFAYCFLLCNSLPNDKILDWSKLKAFADNKIEVLKKMSLVFKRAKNIVGKGENAGYQDFLLFPQCFQKAFYSGLLKVGICGKELTLLPHRRRLDSSTWRYFTKSN